MIKPGIWTNFELGTLPIPARLLFIGLISLADDEGRGRAEARLLRASFFAFDDITVDEVVQCMDMLDRAHFIYRWVDARGREYYVLPTWKRHQRIDRPRPSEIELPPFDELPEWVQATLAGAAADVDAWAQGAEQRQRAAAKAARRAGGKKV